MNTLSHNPFQIIKKRNFNDLSTIGFRYVIRYRKSLLIPVIILAAPLQVAGIYFYMRTIGSTMDGNIMFSSMQFSFQSMAINLTLFILCALLAGSFLLSVIFYHLDSYAGFETREHEEDFTFIIQNSFRYLLKVIGSIIVLIIVSAFILIPILFLIIYTLHYLFTGGGGILEGILFLLLIFGVFLFLFPILSYFVSVIPYAWHQRDREKGFVTSLITVSLSVLNGIRKNLLQTWGISFLLIIIFSMIQSALMAPFMIFLAGGLITPMSDDTVNLVSKLFTLSFASVLQSVFSVVIIICYLYLYGHNKDLISGISLEKEIESL